MELKLVKILLSVLVAMFLFMSAAPRAFCAERGGYDSVRLANSTIDALRERDAITVDDEKMLRDSMPPSQSDPLSYGPELLAFYDILGEILIERKLISLAEATSAKRAAAESGGLKIGGINPVVLNASYLNALAGRGVIPLSVAQGIIDASVTP